MEHASEMDKKHSDGAITRSALRLFTTAYLDLFSAEYPFAEPAYCEAAGSDDAVFAFVEFTPIFVSEAANLNVVESAKFEIKNSAAVIVTSLEQLAPYKKLIENSFPNQEIYAISISELASKSGLKEIAFQGIGWKPCVTAFVEASNFLSASSADNLNYDLTINLK